jgi:hypothetical protein
MVCVLVRGLVGLVVVLLDTSYSSSIRFRGDDRSFGFQRNYGPRFPSRGAHTPSVGHGKFGGKGMMFANPSFEQMARHWFNFLCANPSVESLAHSRFVSDYR